MRISPPSSLLKPISLMLIQNGLPNDKHILFRTLQLIVDELFPNVVVWDWLVFLHEDILLVLGFLLLALLL